MSTSPTPRQAAAYDYLRAHVDQHAFPPTIQEFATHFGIKSPAGVVGHLKALEQKGRIVRECRKSRAVRITSEVNRIPECILG